MTAKKLIITTPAEREIRAERIFNAPRDRVWAALTSMIKLEDKVNRQAEAMKLQQQKIEDLTGRVIRLEAQLELLTAAAMVKRLKGE